MAGRIEVYIDIVSVYSYVAFKHILDTLPLLRAHGVEVEFKPVLLGGINAGSGNKPPWTLPVKARYGRYDFARSKRAAGLAEITPPTDLMAVSRSMLPLRALHYIKAHAAPDAYVATWRYMFHLFWGPDKRVFNQADELAAVLAEIPRGYGAGTDGTDSSSSWPRLFTGDEVARIVDATGEDRWKNVLKATVDEALERGAFGAPWIWATNAKGEGEPFFGSDRWHFIYDFLGLPYQKLALLGPGEKPHEKPKL